MKRIAYQFASPVRLTVAAAAALFASIAFAGPSQGTWSDVGSARQGSLIQVSSHKKSLPDETIEARIKMLHEKLEITSAQEDQWNKVAQVMRDNAEKLSTLVKARMDNSASMTAVDNLKSYAAISGAHEDGTKNLIPVFELLYNSLSEDQKKAADAAFRNHGPEGHHHHH